MSTVYMHESAFICEACAEKFGYEPGDAQAAPESETPVECDRCGKFLENPLRADGVKVVLESIAEALAARAEHGLGYPDLVAAWAAYYGREDGRVTLEALKAIDPTLEIDPRWTSVADVFVVRGPAEAVAAYTKARP